MYVYLRINQGQGTYVYAVGFYDPRREWIVESEWPIREQAAARVHYLNGGDLQEELLPPPRFAHD